MAVVKVRGRRNAHPPSGSGRSTPAPARCAAESGSGLRQQLGEPLLVRGDVCVLRRQALHLLVELVLTPLYVKTRVSSGLGDGLACAEVCHDALVDLSRKEAFQASDDLAFSPAIGGASGDVVAGWLVESHADDDGSIEGGVGLWVANS